MSDGSPTTVAATSSTNRGDEYTFLASDFGIDTLHLSLRGIDLRRAEETLSFTHTVDTATGEVVPIWSVSSKAMIKDPATGALFVLHTLPSGERLLKAETRLSALLGGSSSVRSLAAPEGLQEASNAVLALGERLGLITSSPSIVSVPRIDLATDVFFPNRCDGQALLKALSHLHLSRCKRQSTDSPTGFLETVEWFQAKGTAARAYDKTAESQSRNREGPGRSGSVVRLERQFREPKPRQHLIDGLGPHRLGEMFQTTFKSWHKTRIEVVPRDTVVEKVLSLAGESDAPISLARAERLIGTAAVLAAGAQSVYDSRTLNRRLAEIRDLGIVVGDDLTAPFALSDAVSAFLDPWGVHV